MIDVARLPAEIHSTDRAVLWRYETRNGKRTKVPHVPGRPSDYAGVNDPSTWGAFGTALASFNDGKADGIGIVLGDGLVGVDLDKCRDPDTGRIEQDALDIIKHLDSYTEISPSGRGVHVLVRGLLPSGGRRKGNVEMYSDLRYFTLTGAHVEGTPPTIEERTAALLELHTRIFASTNGKRVATKIPAAPNLAADDAALLDRARKARNGAKFAALYSGDTAGYDSPSEADQALANLLAFWTDRDLGRMDRLFRQSGLMREKWDELRGELTYGQRTIETAFAGCNETFTPWAHTGHPSNPAEPREAERADARSAPTHERILDPRDPLAIARQLIADRYTHSDGRRTLYAWRGDMRAWSGTHYPIFEDVAARAVVYRYLEPAQRITKYGLEPFRPTTNIVNNVLDALRAAAHLDSRTLAPSWLDGRKTESDPRELIACANGVLYMPTRRLLPHNPALFCTHALPFAFESDVGEPVQWLRFLRSLWPDDAESIETLQEVFGYIVSGETRQQKAFLLVGPRRGGKGTIARVVRGLMSTDNVAGPTLSSLATNFGLQSLIGRPLAVISDARLSGRTDETVIVERLLSITGEDVLTVDRKYRDPWIGQLPTRFVVLTNELPRLSDTSGALAGRFIILSMKRSWYGREDTGLYGRLVPELPGILLWALDGWDRLGARRRFAMPQSSADSVHEMEDLSSPVGAFVRDCCIVEPGAEVDTGALYARWQGWCEEHGRRHPCTEQVFGRDLRAAVPGLTTGSRRSSGKRWRVYVGIRICVGGDTG